MINGKWLMIILLIALVILICFAIGWSYRNKNPTPKPEPLPPYGFTRPENWSKSAPSVNQAKNTCQVYTFPDSMVDGVFVPGQPSLNPKMLDNMSGGGIPVEGCLDYNMIMAQQISRTCLAPFGTDSQTVSKCVTLDGTVVTSGAVENLYSDVNCSQLVQCVGELSLINIGVFNNGDRMCLQVDENSLPNDRSRTLVGYAKCDPSNGRQVFRVTRVDIGQQVGNLGPKQPQNGSIAQIYDRTNQGCLGVLPGGVNPNLFPYDPNIVGCTGESPDTFLGQQLVIGPCDAGVSPGFSWYLKSSAAFCDNPGGCLGCTGANGYTGLVAPTGCTGTPGMSNCGCTGPYPCSNCTGHTYMVPPPEFIYVGNQMNNYPIDRVYRGLTGGDALFQWILDQDFPTIYNGGGTTGVAIAKFQIQSRGTGYDLRECWQRGFISQYYPIKNYNSNFNIPPCIAGLELPNCVDL